MKSKSLIPLLLSVATVFPTSLLARTAVYGPAYDASGAEIPNTFNVYEVIGVPDQGDGLTTGQNWYNAHLAATGRVDPIGGTAVTGNLAAATSPELNAWLHQLGGRDNAWIGLTDDEATFGGTEAGTNPNGGWVWTNGDTFSYQNFAPGEPNDSGGEDVAHIRADALWNDQRSDIPGSGQTGTQFYRGLVQYRTEIGISDLNAFKVTVYDARPDLAPAQVDSLARVDELIAGTASYFGRTATTGNSATASLGGSDVHFTPNTAYPGGLATDGSAEDFAIVGRGILTVGAGEGGDYTFGISGDDGGRFLIDLTGDSDFDDPGEQLIVDDALHGNIDQFGVVNLAAGTYAFEWVGFERGGGDGWDAFYSKGDQLGTVTGGTFNANVTNGNGWYAVGDGTAGITSTEPDGLTPGLAVTTYQKVGPGGAFDVNDFGPADQVIADAANRNAGFGTNGAFTVYLSTVNINDEMNANGNFGSGTSDQDAVPGFPSANQDDLVIVAEGWIDLTAGDWTLAGDGDDGQRFSIDLNGDGDFDDPGEVGEGGCCGDRFHNITVGADGRYKVEYMVFENGGDLRGEFFAAPGHTTDIAQFKLIGDTANGGVAVWQVVPEPSSSLLLLAGLAAISLRRRSSRRA